MGTKYLHLVRHAQYHTKKEFENYGQLTSLGVYQARRVARRIKEHEIDLFISSTLTRAQETSEIVVEECGGAEFKSSRQIVEGIPPIGKNHRLAKKYQNQDLQADGDRMKKAFDRFFTPNKRKKDRHEVIVCHGNVIRFWTALALDIPTEKWLSFDICHCSITTVKIDSSGNRVLLKFGDIGHLPLSKQTFI